jgi:alpha-galactosidase
MAIINDGIRFSWTARIGDNGGAAFRFTAGAAPDKLRPCAASGALNLGVWTFDELLQNAGMDDQGRRAFFSGPVNLQPGGWQSWSAGWELDARETLPRSVRLMPDIIKLTNREGDRSRAGTFGGRRFPTDAVPGHFIMYLRSGDQYLCLASRNRLPPGAARPPSAARPPVSFQISRKRQSVAIEVFCPSKAWQAGEVIAEVDVISAGSFFALRDALAALFAQRDNFSGLAFLYPGDGAMSPNVVRAGGFCPGGYESWYNHYTNIDEKLIRSDLTHLDKNDNLLKIRYIDRKRPLVFQIDDGWERAVGDWSVNTERFPQGLRPLAGAIAAAGYIPGLWLAPFLVTRNSPVFTERPEWTLREPSRGGGLGKPVRAGFNPLWDGFYYCLDLSRADVQDYLRSLMDRVIDEWGFRYIKLDFLYAGFLSGNFAGGGSPYEHYETACAILTARNKTAKGEPVAYLGCGLPLGSSWRHFPLSRIGTDTREEWDWNAVRLLGHVGRPSAWLNIKDTIGRAFLNGAVYLNDPDVVFLRSNNCRLTETEKELIALVNFLLADQIMYSDDPAELAESDLALAKRISALYDRLSGDEYGATQLERDVYRLESRSGKTAGLINLRGGPYRLASTQPGAAKLFAALERGEPLVDHRIGTRGPGGTMRFAPHSITMALNNSTEQGRRI